MAQAKPRFVVNEISVRQPNLTGIKLMKWQKLGPDNKPLATVFLRREVVAGHDSVAEMNLTEKIKELKIEDLFKLKETNSKSLEGQTDALRRLLMFETEQETLQHEFNSKEEEQLLRKMQETHEGKPLPI